MVILEVVIPDLGTRWLSMGGGAFIKGYNSAQVTSGADRACHVMSRRPSLELLLSHERTGTSSKARFDCQVKVDFASFVLFLVSFLFSLKFLFVGGFLRLRKLLFGLVDFGVLVTVVVVDFSVS